MDRRIESLQIGDLLANKDICELFGCSPQGGMRRSLKTNTLVLITSQGKEGPYNDRWKGDVLHYTGEGQRGNQVLQGQNKTLAESMANGVAVHLFSRTAKDSYRYEGRVHLAEEPYNEQQNDADLNPRAVWVFPIRPR